MENLQLTTTGNILEITLNRPDKLNALNRALLAELARVLADHRESSVQGVIITGSGPKAFAAGADIAEFANYSVDEGREMATGGQHDVFDAIAGYPKPVIAAINGFALGGGLELALACHLRIAAEGAKLGLPETLLGLIPGYGGTQRLMELAGRGRALQLILTGDMLAAADALQWGVVNEVVPAEGLMEAARAMMHKIIARSPMATAAAIKAVNTGLTRAGYNAEIEEFASCFGTADFKEGTQAFLGRRKPDFNSGKADL